ncbi:MAG: hypothetical protein A3B68_07215 [Candidatus Melainabacteria bacterium RIFCSPHIGHO2_02_FULL_34_12]|nr:MAG: hypothetical protein A3B68_07215 [Candidatus Melainabacteria bacterium RIFCSPHIGHO2_02_FULL_34_12]
MAKALTIKARPRENKKPNALRASGFVPATVYGHGFNSESVQINAKEFSKIPHKAYSHINELDIEGKEKYPVLIRTVQIDPVKDNYLNIEFYRIKADEKLKVKVPLNYVGHSPAVTAGGVLIVSYNEVEIYCLPKDIPDFIDINLEDIKEIGQAIHAKDVKINQNITLLAKGEEVLVKVEIAKTHEIEEVAPAVAEVAIPAEGAAPPAAAAETATATPVAGKEAAAGGKGPQTKAPESKPSKK